MSRALRVRHPSWDDAIDSGDSGAATADFGPLGLSGLVLVALIEEDFGPDDSPGDSLAQTVTNRMSSWNHHLAGAVSGNGTLANRFRLRFRDTIRDYLVNDDLLSVKRFNVPQTLQMAGDQAVYNVALKPA